MIYLNTFPSGTPGGYFYRKLLVMQDYKEQEERGFGRHRHGGFHHRHGGFQNFEQHRARKRFGFGLIILVIGLLILLKQFGFEYLMPIRSFWPFVLIIIGVILGLKNNFRSPAPFILIMIGLAHAIPSFSFEIGDTTVYSRKLVAPIILIGAGLFFLLVSRKKKSFMPGHEPRVTSNENYLNKEVIFGGAKEIVTSKEFTGGDITTVFGGADINLTQADTTAQTVEIYVRTVFGGCEIIVPSHWDVKNEMFVALGSVEDQRTLRVTDASVERKTLILKGFCVFGSVEVRSF
jgi:predicted membrane protein